MSQMETLYEWAQIEAKQKLFNDSPEENKKQKPTGFKCLSDSGNILKTPHEYFKCQN